MSGDKLTATEYIGIMNKHLTPIKFIDSKLSLKQFGGLFQGAEELANMFEYYQTGKMERDISLTKKLNKNLLSFEAWILNNKKSMLDGLSK